MRCNQVRVNEVLIKLLLADLAPSRRIPHLLPRCRNFLHRYDLPSCARLRQKESVDLHLHLFHSRLGFGHVCEGVRHRGEADTWRKQSIHSGINICVHDRHRLLYLDANELLQQSPQPVLHLHVSVAQYESSARGMY